MEIRGKRILSGGLAKARGPKSEQRLKNLKHDLAYFYYNLAIFKVIINSGAEAVRKPTTRGLQHATQQLRFVARPGVSYKMSRQCHIS